MQLEGQPEFVSVEQISDDDDEVEEILGDVVILEEDKQPDLAQKPPKMKTVIARSDAPVLPPNAPLSVAVTWAIKSLEFERGHEENDDDDESVSFIELVREVFEVRKADFDDIRKCKNAVEEIVGKLAEKSLIKIDAQQIAFDTKIRFKLQNYNYTVKKAEEIVINRNEDNNEVAARNPPPDNMVFSDSDCNPASEDESASHLPSRLRVKLTRIDERKNNNNQNKSPQKRTKTLGGRKVVVKKAAKEKKKEFSWYNDDDDDAEGGPRRSARSTKVKYNHDDFLNNITDDEDEDDEPLASRRRSNRKRKRGARSNNPSNKRSRKDYQDDSDFEMNSLESSADDDENSSSLEEDEDDAEFRLNLTNEIVQLSNIDKSALRNNPNLRQKDDVFRGGIFRMRETVYLHWFVFVKGFLNRRNSAKVETLFQKADIFREIESYLNVMANRGVSHKEMKHVRKFFFLMLGLTSEEIEEISALSLLPETVKNASKSNKHNRKNKNNKNRTDTFTPFQLSNTIAMKNYICFCSDLGMNPFTANPEIIMDFYTKLYAGHNYTMCFKTFLKATLSACHVYRHQNSGKSLYKDDQFCKLFKIQVSEFYTSLNPEATETQTISL